MPSREHITSRRTREEVMERSGGKCECDSDIHDHAPYECNRKAAQFAWCEGAPHVDNPDSVMFFCARCSHLIKLARG